MIRTVRNYLRIKQGVTIFKYSGGSNTKHVRFSSGQWRLDFEWRSDFISII